MCNKWYKQVPSADRDNGRVVYNNMCLVTLKRNIFQMHKASEH